MRKTVLVKKDIEMTDDIICNMCGETCFDGECNFNGLIEVSVDGSYGSKFLEDGVRYTFSMCELCLKRVFDKCKIPPDTEEVGVGLS